MTAFKDVLCLMAIFIAYGIAGRLDYEDAVLLEQITQERQHAEPISNPSPNPPSSRPDNSRCWPRSM